ncbi:glutamate racemase [Vibrio zhanjiangensis]|uniref:Glutamate racemase n=1 Tax=Vibrio zhanjiangensis TaxID=1046128 RepID=A0ABQ6F6V1_9VIBR|nr:glutamate racemase [Vibrio zhanjiangensis]GLT20315.1 glutamate racemase [Vibrio zhanjiangensis]
MIAQSNNVGYQVSQQTKILIFDSGVGGLSVFREIEAKLPHINYFYIFDNAAYPYGELEHDTLISRVDKLVCHYVQKLAIDLVVIACNTASTIVLPTLRAKLSIPVVGVVPAIKPASNLANKAIGLIATPATVAREYTHELIKDFSNAKPVELLGSTRLVDMAEEKLRGQQLSQAELHQVLEPMTGKVDVAVLGCTHFPLIKEEIQNVLGTQVLLVDSGEAIARRVQELLGQEILANPDKGQRKIFSTAPPYAEGALNKALQEWGFSPVQLEILDR